MSVKARIDVAGHKFNMSGENGYGFINLAGNWTLIQFSAPFESMPPQGSGSIIGQTFPLQVISGQLMYDGQIVHVEVKGAE
jgi:hypothetical protein